VFLIVAMLALLLAFFALFVGLVHFAEHVIRPRGETASPSVDLLAEPTVDQAAAP
jgi:hypothetical protein